MQRTRKSLIPNVTSPNGITLSFLVHRATMGNHFPKVPSCRYVAPPAARLQRSTSQETGPYRASKAPQLHRAHALMSRRPQRACRSLRLHACSVLQNPHRYTRTASPDLHVYAPASSGALYVHAPNPHLRADIDRHRPPCLHAYNPPPDHWSIDLSLASSEQAS